MYGKLSPARLYELTGNKNARFNTLIQIGVMQTAGQGWILDKACKFLFTPDLMIHFLTGESTAEYTITSR